MENKTYIEINLKNLTFNYLHCQKIASEKRSRIIPVLKSNAYGFGILQVAVTLFEAGCREFVTVDFFEGLQVLSSIRQSHPNVSKKDVKIYVLKGFDDTDIDAFIENNIVPVICDINQLRMWKIKGCKSIKPGLFIETGINRFSMREQELLKAQNEGLLSIEFSMLMSHLACPGDSTDNLNQTQKDRFDRLSKIVSNLSYEFKSIGASNTLINLDKSFYYDAIRVGSALYGFVDIVNDRSKDIKNVYSVHSKIIKIFNIKEGDFVSYSRSYKAKRDTKVAILPFGYSHGLPRYFSNKFQLFYQQFEESEPEFFNVIGNIAMDFCAIDITDAKTELKVDDRIYFCNEKRTIMDIMNQFSKQEEMDAQLSMKLSGGVDSNDITIDTVDNLGYSFERNIAKTFYRYDYTINTLKLKSNIIYIK